MEVSQSGSFDELLRELQELSDDFESVEILVADSVLTMVNGEMVAGQYAAVIRRVGDKQRLLNAELTERLLNDGILNRMGIEVKLRRMSRNHHHQD